MWDIEKKFTVVVERSSNSELLVKSEIEMRIRTLRYLAFKLTVALHMEGPGSTLFADHEHTSGCSTLVTKLHEAPKVINTFKLFFLFLAFRFAGTVLCICNFVNKNETTPLLCIEGCQKRFKHTFGGRAFNLLNWILGSILRDLSLRSQREVDLSNVCQPDHVTQDVGKLLGKPSSLFRCPSR